MTGIGREFLLAEIDKLLQPGRFQDYCPNGLQVEGRETIGLLVTGVTASQALLERAIAAGADAILVHHGYFWRGDASVVTGMLRRRLGLLLAHDVNLLAYHLPLDAHPEFGNNASLARVLGIGQARPAGDGVSVWQGQLPAGLSATALASHLAQALSRKPLHVGTGPAVIRSVAWCTGAAQGYLREAVALGVDAYITGEISEQTVHEARENGIHCFAAGHHATERYGVQALGEYLAGQFGIQHQFFEDDNPV